MISERLRDLDRRAESRVPLSLREEVRGRVALVILMQAIGFVASSLHHLPPYMARYLCFASVIVLIPLLRHSWVRPGQRSEVEPLGRVEWPAGRS